ncbi:hypothetical protein [Herminiimonas sp. CN]|uniref:hypothetical protein n=1 Tax=Herminiimonas sp. CN TaxID=1349818 RepID=UPI000473695E|nr:hypothetical protein [Herminiimonas sp. CN]
MKKQHVLLVCAFLAGLGFGLPAGAEPPPWAPAHGYRSQHAHRYVYYPARQVYYAPETRSWFWFSGGNWQAGVTLPSQYQAYVSSGGVSISLNASRPYIQHVYVEEHYGRPWRAEHRHERRGREEWRHNGHNDQRGYDGDHGRNDDRRDGGRGNGHGHGRQD